MAQLVLYGSTVADSTLPSACDLASSSGGAEVTATSDWSFAGNYGELRSQDGTFSGGSSIPTTPTGNGWIVYPGAGTFAAGNWSASFAHSSTTPSTVDFTIRFFNYESGIYVLLGSITLSSQTTTTGRKVFAFPATAMASLFIDTPQFLYVDLWEHDSAGLGSDGTLYLSSSSVAGVVNDLQITTSDFAAGGGSGRIDPTVFGSSVPDATLTTACDVAPTTGGIEASMVSTYTGSGNFGEVYSQGGNVAASASLPAGESGHGWLYQPGAGTFAAGNWSASFKVDTPNNAGSWNLRFSKYSAGSYTPIGTITRAISNIGTYTESFAATAMPAVTLGASDSIYFSLWAQDTSGIVGEAWTAFVSTTATFGVANDAQVSTSTFTPAPTAPLVKPYVHFSIPRALGGTIIPLVISPPVIYEPRALGSTLLTDSRIFIPRALGGTYVQDDPTLLWVPHALGGTTQVQTGVALSSTMPGIGLESTTLSLSTTLTGTIPGVGILAPTLTAKLALGSVTLPAIGVLAPSALTESTALTDILPAVGTLSGSLLASLDLGTSTIPAVGTLTGTFTESTALAVTIPAVGTLTGTLSTSANVNLSVTIPAVGTVTMAGAALSTALATSIPAVGVLNPVLSASIGLTATSIPAVGTIVGTPGASAPLSSTVVGRGTLSVTMASSTSLTSSLSAVGTAVGTLTVGNSVSFTVTIPAVGTLTASAPGLKTTLTASIAALGTIAPGATFSEALSGTTLAAIGTISGTVSLAVILGVTLPGAGTISAAYQVRTALSLQLMAVGALLGTLRVPATFFGPYGATKAVSSKLTSTHTVTSKSSQHVSSTYTATRK